MAKPDPAHDRSGLMARHVEARGRRDAAPAESDEFRAASEEIAKIETAIAAMEEPPVPSTAEAAAAPEGKSAAG